MMVLLDFLNMHLDSAERVQYSSMFSSFVYFEECQAT